MGIGVFLYSSMPLQHYLLGVDYFFGICINYAFQVEHTVAYFNVVLFEQFVMSREVPIN